MGQFSLTTHSKASTEDAEAANTATQQNKTNIKVAVDPTVIIKHMRVSRSELIKTFRCFLCLFLLVTILFGGFVIFVQLNWICQSIADVSAFSGDSVMASDNELLSKNIEKQQEKYESLQKAHDDLKNKFEQMLSAHIELNTRFTNCENSNFQMMSFLQAAFDDFIKRGKNCNLMEEVIDPTTLRPEGQKYIEVIDFNRNEENSEKITIHAKIRTILKSASSEPTQNLNEMSGQQTKE